jgi:outer membrane immunogenic protein
MRLVCLSAIVVALAGPALAADLPTRKGPPEAPPVASAYDWTGAFVGVNFGWADGENSWDAYRTNTVTAPKSSPTVNALLIGIGLPAGAFLDSGKIGSQTFHGGGEFGYNYMFPSRVVIGGTVSVNVGTDSSSRTVTPTGSVSTSKNTDTIGGAALAKLGYAFGDVLPYVDGGFAWTGGTTTRTQLVGNASPNGTLVTLPYSDSLDYTRLGWDVGAGLAFHIWQGWEIYAQYDHREFGRSDFIYANANVTTKSSLTTDSVTLGVDYKF